MAGIEKLQSVNIRELQGRKFAAVEKQNSADSAKIKSFGDTISEFVKAVNDSQKMPPAKWLILFKAGHKICTRLWPL